MRSPPKDAPRGKHPVAGVHRYRNGGIIECPYSPHPYALARQVNRMVIAEAAEVAGIARPAGRADLTARLTRPRERQGSGLGQDSEDDEEDEDEDEDEEEDEDEDVDDDDDDEDDDEDEEGEEGMPARQSTTWEINSRHSRVPVDSSPDS